MSSGSEPSPYRKKPVTITAWQLTDADDADWEAIAEWCGGRLENTTFGVPGADPDTVLRIDTLEGVMTALAGDWIICGVKGEFYPCREDIFAETYEQA